MLWTMLTRSSVDWEIIVEMPFGANKVNKACHHTWYMLKKEHTGKVAQSVLSITILPFHSSSMCRVGQNHKYIVPTKLVIIPGTCCGQCWQGRPLKVSTYTCPTCTYVMIAYASAVCAQVQTNVFTPCVHLKVHWTGNQLPYGNTCKRSVCTSKDTRVHSMCTFKSAVNRQLASLWKHMQAQCVHKYRHVFTPCVHLKVQRTGN